jgi:thymidine kinase
MASLYFKYAAMNSGKSTQLLQAHYNYFERGMRAIAFTAKLDDRYGVGKISARIGLDLPAFLYAPETDIFTTVEEAIAEEKIHVILIDEAQFLTEDQVLQAARIVDDLQIPVMAYGLKTDFMGKLFEGSEALVRLADNLEEIKTICWCGKKATQTARIDENGTVVRSGDQVSIGGNDLYVSLCRKHYHQGISKPLLNAEEVEHRRDQVA